MPLFEFSSRGRNKLTWQIIGNVLAETFRVRVSMGNASEIEAGFLAELVELRGNLNGMRGIFAEGRGKVGM